MNDFFGGVTGMNDILPKPFTQDGLLEMLEVFIHPHSVIRTFV